MSQTFNMLKQPKVEKEDVKMENVSDAMVSLKFKL